MLVHRDIGMVQTLKYSNENVVICGYNGRVAMHAQDHDQVAYDQFTLQQGRTVRLA